MNEELAQETVARVSERFRDAVEDSSTVGGEAVVVISLDKLKDVAKWLQSGDGFTFLSSLTAIDWPKREDRFVVVYDLLDPKERRRIRVKVRIPTTKGGPPTVPSVTDIWAGANWHEREVFDMFGISFDGHPDLTRILMPDEWEGHPLRKDYSMGKVPVEYKTISPGF